MIMTNLLQLRLIGKRDQRIAHSLVQSAKCRQQIYQITTNSVIDGVRLHKTNPSRDICPHHGKIVSAQHILADCVFVKSIWQIIDKLGNDHWEDYSP